MIEHGACDWNLGLEWACEGGHIDIVQFMIEKGATDWELGLRGACLGGHMNLVQFMIDKGATNWNGGGVYLHVLVDTLRL
jgi:hypothetical protein